MTTAYRFDDYQVRDLCSSDRVSLYPQNHSVVNGISNGRTSPSNVGAGGSGEAECEDNMSDDGCSVAGTECSVGGASEATTERMYVANISTFHILSLTIIFFFLLQYHILVKICWAFHNSFATYVSAANNLPFIYPFSNESCCLNYALQLQAEGPIKDSQAVPHKEWAVCKPQAKTKGVCSETARYIRNVNHLHAT